ncbi:Sro9p [Sugiyamaella lignohabitans]|uniref:Sro9p n=1 Tax=Sugiyamaella lignohabitans TaxID=796027 RepID=A0A167DMQ8_9ASCO|nr:Sro9p [Sugiyamaella lignohabitans]ANB13081.1 Sro9p [Sugiyamaella lignohabitans]
MYGQQMFPSHPPASQYDVALGLIIAQIEYYLSVENLCKDMYLRRQMNSDGLVPLSVLANFNRVKALTNGDYNFFFEAASWAPSAQVIGDRIRPRIGWETWVLPVNDRLPGGLEELPRFQPIVQEEEQAPKFNAAAAVPFVPKSKSNSTSGSPANESSSN